MGLGLGNCCCGCSCCTTNPASWTVTWTPTSWGTGSTSFGSCTSPDDACGHMAPASIVLDFPESSGGWPDSGIVDSYLTTSNRSCAIGETCVNATGCSVFFLCLSAGLYKSADEDGCRLVIRFYGTSSGNLAVYRSPEITDCCATLTLDLYVTGACSSPPSTITATPLCPE